MFGRRGAKVAFRDSSGRVERFTFGQGQEQMSVNTVSVNRAPVLTLWAAVVAKRLGFDEGAALTLGHAVAALNTQSKGRRLGIYRPKEREAKEPRLEEPAEASEVIIRGRTVAMRGTKR